MKRKNTITTLTACKPIYQPTKATNRKPIPSSYPLIFPPNAEKALCLFFFLSWLRPQYPFRRASSASLTISPIYPRRCQIVSDQTHYLVPPKQRLSNQNYAQAFPLNLFVKVFSKLEPQNSLLLEKKNLQSPQDDTTTIQDYIKLHICLYYIIQNQPSSLSDCSAFTSCFLLTEDKKKNLCFLTDTPHNLQPSVTVKDLAWP